MSLTASFEQYEQYEGDYGLELVVIHNGKEILRESDRGEPEDQTFCRNFRWVRDAIETAYRLGLEDAKA